MATLQTFSGDRSEDIRHWLRSVELAAIFHGWTSIQKLAAASGYLIGHAADWLDGQNSQTWTDFCHAAVLRFGQDPEMLLQDLMHAKQYNDEPAKGYMYRFISIADHLAMTSSPVPQTMLVKLFVNGLIPTIQQKVRDRRPSSLEEAGNDADYFDKLQPPKPWETAGIIKSRPTRRSWQQDPDNCAGRGSQQGYGAFHTLPTQR